ncbi:Heat shock protein GrpE [Moraxella catarrhalis]|nr:Heat shock protein GrpE [Moraxella catarrhalis]OAV18293.1 Heat shock protein GrpE [Moraxella catarrhalis]
MVQSLHDRTGRLETVEFTMPNAIFLHDRTGRLENGRNSTQIHANFTTAQVA